MSKGIVIAKTNKNLTTKCKISFIEITTSFSTTNNNIVLIDQTKEIITILKNGILRNPKGYETEITANIKMTVCVSNRKSINLYKLTANEHNIKKKTDFLFFCSHAFLA